MPPLPFTGADFALQSVTQVSLATLRVRFTQDPVLVDPGGANDALNPTLYTVTGPGVNPITAVAEVDGDPQAVEMTFAVPFVVGTWTLAASAALETTTGRTLQEPRSLNFVTSYLTDSESLVAGATNDSPEEVLRKHSNPKVLRGRIWTALRKALAAGDAWVWENARLAFDQLFTCSASGIYLDRKCADDGVRRPPGIGMSDDLYRRYTIKATAKKLTQDSLLEILEVFYGSDAVRAYAESEACEPYVFSQDWTLEFLLDERTRVRVVFDTKDFSQIKQARATEVAAAITRACRLQRLSAFAVAITDPSTGTARVRIYSGSLGLSSSVRILEGQAQAALRFPQFLALYLEEIVPANNVVWLVTENPDNTTTVELRTDAASPPLDMGLVQVGDRVIIDTEESGGVPGGMYPIASVFYEIMTGGPPPSVLRQGFIVPGHLGVTGLYVQQSNAGYRFFHSTKQSIQRSDSRVVVVSQTRPSELNVVLPATTQAVGRTVKTAAYPPSRPAVPVATFIRDGSDIVVTTATAHGLQAGDRILVEGLVSANARPAVTPSDLTTLAISAGEAWSTLVPLRGDLAGRAIAATEDGTVVCIGGHVSVPGWTDVAASEILEINGDHYTFTAINDITYGGIADPRSYASVTRIESGIRNGLLWVAGGYRSPNALATTILLDPATWTWSDGPSLSNARMNHTVTVLADGTILVCGGTDAGVLAGVDLYSPNTNAITALADMNVARTYHDAVLLADGRILVSGGFTGVSALTHCEVYDPGTNTWTRTGSLAAPRFAHRMIRLPDGQVLAIGGMNAIGGLIVEVEAWEPGTGRWRLVCRLPVGRVAPVVSVLSSLNKAMVAFGGAVNHSVDYIHLTTLQWEPGLAYTPTFNPSSLQARVGVTLPGNEVFAWGYGFGAGEGCPFYRPGLRGGSGYGLNGEFAVGTVTAPNEFRYQTRSPVSFCSGTGGTVTPVGAIAATANSPGPYTFDPDVAPAITAVETELTQALVEGQQYPLLQVADASAFPDAEGWLCLGFGTDAMTFPVRYLGRYSDTALVLDYQFKFPHSIEVGAGVTLLTEKKAFRPESAEDLGSFYVTASPSGRVAAIQALGGSVAAGIRLNTAIVYPGDRGLGGAGLPTTGTKISDKVAVFAGDDIDTEVAAARGEDDV